MIDCSGNMLIIGVAPDPENPDDYPNDLTFYNNEKLLAIYSKTMLNTNVTIGCPGTLPIEERQFTINGKIVVHNDMTTPKLNNQQILSRLWRWDGEDWDPYDFERGNTYQSFVGEYYYPGTNNKGYPSVDLFVIISTERDYAPLLVVNEGFIVKKDLAAGGYISSQQGELWLGHGRHTSTDLPKINLIDSDSGYDTLYIRKKDSVTPAHLNLGNLTAMYNVSVGGTLTATGGVSVGEYTGISKDGDSLKLSFTSANPYLKIRQEGAITELYPSLALKVMGEEFFIDCTTRPRGAGICNFGSSATYWYNIFSQNVNYKTGGLLTFGCAKELSDQTVEPRFKSTNEAEAFLRNETTKAWRHVKYADSGKMVCVCGKEVDYPCPEHEAEWKQKYTLNTGDMIEASGNLVVKIIDEIKEIRTAINQLQTKLQGAA